MLRDRSRGEETPGDKRELGNEKTRARKKKSDGNRNAREGIRKIRNRRKKE